MGPVPAERAQSFTRSNLALPLFGAKARHRSLFLAHLLDRIDFAERQLKIQAKQRLFQTIRFSREIFVRHIAILINFFSSLHRSLRSPCFQFSVGSFQPSTNSKLKTQNCKLRSRLPLVPRESQTSS